MNDPHLIGFSLSFCLRDILAGRVKKEDVISIVTGCAPRSIDDVNELVAQYRSTYWKNYPELVVEELFAELHNDHRILWCSSWDKKTVNIGWSISGHCGPWLSTRAQLQHDDATRSQEKVIRYLNFELENTTILPQAQTVLKYLKGDQHGPA